MNIKRNDKETSQDMSKKPVRLTAIDEYLQTLRSRMAASGASRRRLSIRAGLGQNTLNHIMDKSFNPKVQTLRLLEIALDAEEGLISDKDASLAIAATTETL